MAKIVTYNELMKLIEIFVDEHKMLNSFGDGPLSEISTSKQNVYPLMWATHRTQSNIVIQNKTTIPVLTMSFLFLDKINDQPNLGNQNGNASNNTREILSDCFQYAQDFLIHIDTVFRNYGIMIPESSSLIEPLYDETTDKLSGWVIDVDLKLTYLNCELPF